MSITAARLQAEVGAETSGFDRGMAHADSVVKKAPSKWGKALKIGAGVGLGIAAGVIVKGVSTALRGGLTALREDQVVTAQTTAVIKSTGGAAHVTAAQIEALSGAIERKTATEDIAVQAGANMLLTFTNIRNEAGAGNDIFNQSVSILTDMSRAMGTDMKHGAIQLGKALNDPLKGITALTRVGVTFDASQKKRIAAFMKEGKVTEAQKIILAELNKEFGKSGAAFSATDMGQAEQYGFAVEDVEKAFSEGLFPAITNVRAALTRFLRDPATLTAATTLGDKIAGIFSVPNLDKAVGVVTGAVGKITGLATSPEGKGFGDMITGAFKGAAKFAAAIPWDSVGQVMKLTGQGAKAALDMFTSMPDWVKTAVITGWGLNKLTGGALGGIVGELGKGLIKGVLGMNAGVVNINAAAVTGIGGGGGVVPGGVSPKFVAGTVLSAALLVGVLAWVEDNIVMPELNAAADANLRANRDFLKTGTLPELKNALTGLKEMPSKLDPLQKTLYDLNANGVKTHTEALEAAIAAEILSRQLAGKTAEETLANIGTAWKTGVGQILTGLGAMGLVPPALPTPATGGKVTTKLGPMKGGGGVIATKDADTKAAVTASGKATASDLAIVQEKLRNVSTVTAAGLAAVRSATGIGLASTASASRAAATGSQAAAAAIRAKKFSATLINRITIGAAPIRIVMNSRVVSASQLRFALLTGRAPHTPLD